MRQFLGGDQPVLSDQATDLVGLGRALLDQPTSYSVHRLDVLLIYRLDAHESHAGPAHRFADRLGVIGVVLVALHVRLHELRRNQLHLESFLLQLARPVMRATTRLHANLAAGLDRLEQHLHPVLSGEPPAPERLLFPVYAVDLKHVLCQINPNANKLHGGPLLIFDWWVRLPVWHLDAD